MHYVSEGRVEDLNYCDCGELVFFIHSNFEISSAFLGHRLLLNDDDGNRSQHNNQSQQFASIFGMPYPRRFHGNPATAATHS